MSPINHVPTSFSNPIQKSHYCRLLVSTNYYSNIYFGINFTLPISNKAVFALPNQKKKKKKWRRRRKDKAVIVSMHYFIASLTEKTTLASWFTKEHLNNSVINAYDLFYYKICIDSCSKKKKKKDMYWLCLWVYIYIYIWLWKLRDLSLFKGDLSIWQQLKYPFFTNGFGREGYPFTTKTGIIFTDGNPKIIMTYKTVFDTSWLQTRKRLRSGFI